MNFPMNPAMPKAVDRLNAKADDYVQALIQVKQEVQREAMTGKEVETELKTKLEKLAK